MPLSNINGTWSIIDHGKCFLPKIEGHCCASTPDGFYVFGGVVLKNDGSHQESNDLWHFQFKEEKWRLVEERGKKPLARSAACMAALNNKLYIFGGMSATQGWLNDFHCYEIDRNIWDQIEPQGKKPSPRDKCACTVMGKKIYIFGGFGPGGTEVGDNDGQHAEDDDEDDENSVQFGWFNDIHTVDVSGRGPPRWNTPLQLNPARPSPRAATGVCAVGPVLYVFGGRDMEGRKNDLHAFDTGHHSWLTELPDSMTGTTPKPRSYHVMCSMGDLVIVFGGRGQDNQHFNDLHIFDTKTNEWSQPEIKGKVPSPRGNLCMDQVSGNLIIFGGSSDFSPELNSCEKIFNECYKLELNIGCTVTGDSAEGLPQKDCHEDPPTKKTKDS